MIPRHITESIIDAVTDTPVVLLNGARQTGKSTLVQWLASNEHPARYLTLDDAVALSAAKEDPEGFLAGLKGPIILDEVQRVPELFLAIKAEVDRERMPGRFLLTGSADIMLLPQLSKTLVGRIEILTLCPLSQGEIVRIKEGFVDAIFDDKSINIESSMLDHQILIELIHRGGYPEILNRPANRRREAWYRSYITTILQREIRDLSNIDGLAVLPRLLALLAARTTSILNFSELSRSSAIPMSTLKRYLTLLETTFLIQSIPAWSSNLGKRLIKAPKIIMSDTGLLCHLLGMDIEHLTISSTLLGPILENFVIMELKKQIGWSSIKVELYHYRTLTGQEVDIILESPDGRVVAIEVKLSVTVRAGDFRGLHSVSEQLGNRFHRGIVLYCGKEIIPFGSRLFAMPVNALWQ